MSDRDDRLTIFGMEEIFGFLRKAGTYYLATADGDKPRVRPFGTIDLFENGLYIQTGKKKSVSKQIHANPNIEICAFLEGTWLRVEAKAVEDYRREARVHMLEAYPELKSMYSPDDGNTEVFRLTEGKAVFSSFTAEDRTIAF